MSARRAKSSFGRAKPRRQGLDGYLDDLAPLRPPPAAGHLLAVLDWYERLEFGDYVKVTRRQLTAIAAVVSHALTVENDDRLREDAEGLFFHAGWLTRAGRTDIAHRLLRRLATLEDLEERACIALGELEVLEKHWPEARDAYARAWDLNRARARELNRAFDASDADLGCNLAWTQIKSGEVDAAERLLGSLAECCPEHATVKELLRIARSPSARV